VKQLGLAIVLGRSDDEVSLLRRCVDANVPYISTSGALRGLELALEEGLPRLGLEVEEVGLASEVA
jgi:hypothetical protein